jgi:outer membrane protein OmpA-like peptidoglycan-associated protein
MRIVVLITALLWAGASSWWYTCNIKGYCDTDLKTATQSSHVASSDGESSNDTTPSKDTNAAIATSKTSDNAEETNKNAVDPSEDTAAKDEADKTSEPTENDAEPENTPSKDAANTEADTTTEDTAEGEIDTTSEDTAAEQPNPLEEDIPADDDNDDTKIKINRIKNAYPNTDVALLPKIKKVRIYSPSAASKSSDLNTNANRYFDKVVEMLKADENLEIVLTGYTDSKGGETRNKALGLRRAKTLKAIFVSKGAPAERIITNSLGEADPIWSNKTEDGRKKNRRVELESKNKE